MGSQSQGDRWNPNQDPVSAPEEWYCSAVSLHDVFRSGCISVALCSSSPVCIFSMSWFTECNLRDAGGVGKVKRLSKRGRAALQCGPLQFFLRFRFYLDLT